LRFVVTVPVRLARAGGVLLVGVSIGSLLGCANPRPVEVEDSYSSGRITVVTARAAAPVVTREAESFQALYPQARIDVRLDTSREAVEALYAAQTDAAAITRELLPDERRAAVQGRLALDGYRFAREGLVIVVNPDQTVDNLALDELRSIYGGELKDWGQFGGKAGAIVPVVQPPDADITEFFDDAVMQGGPMLAPAVREVSDSAVVDYVSRNPAAVGYVSLRWAQKGAKALRIAAMRGLPYTRPDPEAVYHDAYPLTRYYNLYVRADGSRLADGFVTFVTSRPGQKLVADQGLVPVTVPVRFVRRSPMRALH
jgi:phosphate transport system substrate-binding protein